MLQTGFILYIENQFRVKKKKLHFHACIFSTVKTKTSYLPSYLISAVTTETKESPLVVAVCRASDAKSNNFP